MTLASSMKHLFRTCWPGEGGTLTIARRRACCCYSDRLRNCVSKRTRLSPKVDSGGNYSKFSKNVESDSGCYYSFATRCPLSQHPMHKHRSRSSAPVLASTPNDPNLDKLKSYDLPWLLHLVGDVHQPLHSTTRVSATKPDGDNGGNGMVTMKVE
jgi:hypothetical protein